MGRYQSIFHVALWLSLSSLLSAFASNGHVYVDATIKGTMESSTTSLAAIEVEVRSLVPYVQGDLGNDKNASIRMPEVAVEMVVGEEVDGVVPVSYTITAPMALPQVAADPMLLILPKHGDARRYDFEQAHAACAHSSPFWYYYSPRACSLSSDALPNDGVAATVTWTVRSDNTQGMRPEYDKLWADGVLDVTFVAGNEIEIDPVQSLATQLRESFGAPVSETVVNHGTWIQYVSEHATAAGAVRVNGFYFSSGSFQRAPEDLKAAYRTSQRQSDVVLYNGHAGLGANVRAFQAASEFEPGRHYLFMVNACQPFAYLDPAFFGRVSAVNDGAPWSRHVDFISNVRIGSFSYGYDAAAVIRTLVERTQSYHELLAQLPGDSAVVGEEDNAQ